MPACVDTQQPFFEYRSLPNQEKPAGPSPFREIVTLYPAFNRLTLKKQSWLLPLSAKAAKSHSPAQRPG